VNNVDSDGSVGLVSSGIFVDRREDKACAAEALDFACHAISPNEVRALRGWEPYRHDPAKAKDPMMPEVGGMVVPLGFGDTVVDVKLAKTCPDHWVNPITARCKSCGKG
jgi:hypothetical protein